ncbi:MAG: Peptidoglycan D,D-transpeptidase MrdA [Burkholderiaceae bacterium]|jgi:penicillin-binding protein 2|nr:MAG: Peptidoglycan D,D-transpeptidase MrdA [Burkholderiaceae bacterium]
MTELRNIRAELARFRARVLVAGLVVLFAFSLVIARLVVLQVVRHDELAEQAETNSTAIVPVVPARGQIVDRNGIVLATNYSAYTLEITPSKAGPLEQTIDALSKVVEITPRDRRRFKRLLEDSKSFESVPIRMRLSDEEVARFAAQRFRFPGVEVKARLFRSYPFGSLASHLIGYVGRINQAEKDRIDDSDDEANYRGTQYIGKLGVEQSYENQLHGTTGVQEMETAASGRAVRLLGSVPAKPGDTVQLSIDIRLQHLVEEMYGDRRGAMVALDPKTGEVLALVSMPTFDPNLFVDGIDSDNWKALNESPDKPLLNRALRGTYPPGSTYKPFMAIAALETGKRTPQQTIQDPGYFWFGGHKFRDDKEGGHGTVNMYKSIVESCDTYYYMVANDLGVDTIHDELKPFGFGQLTGIDLPGESRGLLPSTAWKRRAYHRPEQQKWYAGETISLGIGQGYNHYTMLQMATALSALVNHGLKMRPHVGVDLIDPVTHKETPAQPDTGVQLNIKPQYLDVVRNAMVGVNIQGTAAAAFRGAGYTSGGKTGTAQLVGIKENQKYDAARLAARLRDNGLFIAYAPADDPKIVVALVVENSGFGAEAAAPIARRVLDYWLLHEIPNPQDMAAVQKGQATAPIGTPLPASSVPWPPQP